MKLILFMLITYSAHAADDFNWDELSKPNYNMFAPESQSQQQQSPSSASIYGSDGAYAGKVQQNVNNTGNIYDNNGQIAGSYKIINGETFLYDKNGSYVGKSK